MWEKIATYIDQNREDFNSIDVPGDHIWENIAQELDRPKKRMLWNQGVFQYWKTAAVILLGVGLAFWWSSKGEHQVPPSDILEMQHLSSWPQEQEAYESEIEDLLAKVRKYDPDTHIFMGPFMEDVARIDQQLESIHDQVKAHSLNEFRVNQMSKKYQEKIEILKELLTELESSNL